MKATLSDPPGVLRLVDWARLRIHLIWAYQGTPHTPHYDEPRLTPQQLALGDVWMKVYVTAWLMLKGQVRLKALTGEVTQAHAGQWVFPMARMTHDFSSDAEIISVSFVAHWPDDTPLYTHDHPLTCEAAQFPELNHAARQAVRMMQKIQNRPIHVPAEQQGTTMDLSQYVDMSRKTMHWLLAYGSVMSQLGLRQSVIGGGDQRVIILQERIDSIPLGEPLDERAIARSVGLSLSQLNRVFVTRTGMTPRAYRQERRLHFVKESLSNSTMPVKQLAYLLGFRQPNSFSKWFKKSTGVYPREFRKQKPERKMPVRQ